MAKKGGFIVVLLGFTYVSSVVCDLETGGLKCELACGRNETEQSIEEIGYCCRGCRLMRLVDLVTNGPRYSSDILHMCSASCANAYSAVLDPSAVGLCQKGCELELPLVEMRQMQLSIMYREQLKFTRMFSLIDKIMSCQFQSIMSTHETGPGDRYSRTNVMRISSSDGSVSGIMISRKTGYQGYATSVSDLPSEDGPRSVVTKRLIEGRSRLYAHVRRPDPAIISLFVFGGVLLVAFSVLMCVSPQRAESPSLSTQKLSLYGDGDELSMVDDDDALIDLKPRAFVFLPPGMARGKRPQ